MILDERMPPQAVESERAIIGAILSDNSSFIKVSEIITHEDFYRTANSLIYKSMVILYEDGKPIDCLTVGEKLKELGVLEECGGVYELTKMQEECLSPANVIVHANIIKEKHTLRTIITKFCNVIGSCYDLKDSGEILDDISRFAINANEKNSEDIIWNNLLLETIEMIEEKKFETGIHTSLERLDRTIGGWNPGLVIIAARPSHGKTAFAVQAAVVAARGNYPVGIITLEMKPRSLAIRILASEIKADSRKIQGGLGEDEYVKLSLHASKINHLQMYFSNMTYCKTENVKTIARSWVKKYGIKILVIDYLQLMDHVGENRNIAIGNTTRQLKNLAMELSIPILLLSQLSRNNEKEKRPPHLSDLRESGNIEQDADIVIMIHNPDYDSAEEKEIAEFYVRKNREGPTGKFDAMFVKKYTGFENIGNAV